MAIIVKSIKEEFKIIIKADDEQAEFFIKQLTYKTKSFITGLTTVIKNGQVTLDSTLNVFLNLKFGLKRVKGLVDVEGNEYKLEFDDKDNRALTDECVDELLATALSDNLQYCARELNSNVYPSVVLNPLTEIPLEGVEVIPADKLRGVRKKSSPSTK